MLSVIYWKLVFEKQIIYKILSLTLKSVGPIENLPTMPIPHFLGQPSAYSTCFFF